MYRRVRNPQLAFCQSALDRSTAPECETHPSWYYSLKHPNTKPRRERNKRVKCIYARERLGCNVMVCVVLDNRSLQPNNRQRNNSAHRSVGTRRAAPRPTKRTDMNSSNITRGVRGLCLRGEAPSAERRHTRRSVGGVRKAAAPTSALVPTSATKTISW